MNENIRIFCKNNGQHYQMPVGSSLLEILKAIQLDSPYPIVCARVNNKTEGLKYKVYNSKIIEYLNLTTSTAMRTYVRSLCFLLYKATNELFPNSTIRIEHPISKGYFCNLQLNKAVEQKDIDAIYHRMKQLAEQNIPFTRMECETEEAIRLFQEKGMDDKAQLLQSINSLYTHYYQLGDHIDYFYGALLPSTGYLKLFGLSIYENGVLLQVPNRATPNILETINPQPKMLKAFEEYTRFNSIIGFHNVGRLNKLISKGGVGDLIKVTEALQEKKIAKIADEISTNPNIHLILIAGPSSSGKTTFTKRLSIQLMTNLKNPIAISLDNYFVNRDQTPLDEHGEHDFESLYSLDLEQFNKDLNELLKGNEIELPSYNFETGKREYHGEKIKLHPNDILLLEGIHALNPELTPLIDQSQKFLIYVSALTSISLDDHNWIPTTDNRLLRRIIRDSKYRKHSAKATIDRWDSVRRGEEKWIFPFQEHADAMFNSALMFELAVLKRQAEPLLMEVPENSEAYSEAHRLLKFLSYFQPILEKEIQPTSLLREFLGGSSFKY